jgi:hypothetical protein
MSLTIIMIGQTKKKEKKERMRGEEGKWQASFLSSKFEIMFTFFQLEEKKFKGVEGKGTNGRK